MKILPHVRAPEIDRITTALRARGGVLTIAADTAQEAAWLRGRATGEPEDTPGLAQLDLTRCSSSRDLAVQLARAAAATYAGRASLFDIPHDQLTPEQRSRLVTVADRAGRRVLDAARGIVAPDDENPAGYQRLVGEACDLLTRRAADGEETLLAIDGADELVEPPRRSRMRFVGAGELLWLVRGRLQNAVVTPAVVFSGGPATTDLVSDRDAAFFGWGTEVIVGPPDEARFHEAVVDALAERRGVTLASAHEATRALVRLVQGSVPTAEKLIPLVTLDAGLSPDAEVYRAWTTLLELSADLLRQTARALGSLDRLALAVAQSIAQERPPYALPGGPHSSEVAKALASLRIAGFAVSRQRGEWRLTDPLLAAWFRGPEAFPHLAI